MEKRVFPPGDSPKERRRQALFGQKNILAALILTLVVLAGIITSYFFCTRIAQKRALDQFEDAVNNVTNQINSKFEREGAVLRAMAQILADSGAFAEDGSVDHDALTAALGELKPLQQSMNLRILLPGDEILLPDDTIVGANLFRFDEEVEEGEHISKRFESQRTGVQGTQLIAHFVPIIRGEGENAATVAMLYGVTALVDLPADLRTDNLYNSQASVMILDVKSETKDIIMDTLHTSSEDGRLGSFSEFTGRRIRGEDDASMAEKIMGLQTGYTVVKSPATGKWTYFYYAPAGGVVSDRWCICISVPESVAFGNVQGIRTTFLVAGIITTIALAAYFIFVRFTAKAAIRQSVEQAVLEEKLHKAEAAERAKTAFLSNMSHDIRTPMNAILGYTALAETNIDNRERVQDYLGKILSSGNHLLSLINDILDMSRIESGKFNIEEKPCSISDIFRDMRNIIQTQMKTKQLNFFMDTVDVMDEEIWCDKLHLNQILLNLLSNAIKFTPAGGSVSLTIRQLAGAPTGYGSYEIRVKDTGIGMSEEFAKHIFEPFERERTSTVSGIQGTGLGMAITKNIVDTMGGTIELHTEKDHGTEFILHLQFRLADTDRTTGSIRELEGLRALVVDDSFTTCDSITKMLGTIGMRAEWTLYGKEAVLRTKQALDIGEPFAVYIIDWVMPDLPGFEIVRQIRRAVGDDVPIIIVTAYDVEAIMEEAEDIHVDAWCNKPLFLSDLRETLISCLKLGEKSPADTAAEDARLKALSGKHLLLVEDNELNREIAEELLTENGFLVDTAADGTEAVARMEKAQKGDYDLILMDVQMPIMNGYDATRAIRKLPAGATIPIVAMTANAFDEDRKQALASGMNAHVAKPIDLSHLIEVLENLLLPDKGSDPPHKE